MPDRIEDYALLGDLQTAALVGRHGSVDWLCFPRFDSGACFAALLGDERHGRWLMKAVGTHAPASRRYLHQTLVLETTWRTDEGTARVLDFMPPRGQAPDIIRIVEGIDGRVRMRTELVIRFDYGSIVPWVSRVRGNARIAVAGPDALCLRTPVDVRGEDMRTVAEFTVDEGERVPFVLTWYPSHRPLPRRVDPERALEDTIEFWHDWSNRCTHKGGWWDEVQQSLIVLKALTYAPTGGIVAAPTTSLPEQLGGVRNWDYRYCWLRDATLTLLAFLHGGYEEEAKEWRTWLARAVAGSPADLQIMYGVAGERRLTELELDWLPGYEGSRPVRVGNAASDQRQLDVYGEVMDALYQAREQGLGTQKHYWQIQRVLLRFLETAWREPDEGIWEVRGGAKHFTHSKVMAWVAFDRAVRTVESHGLDGPVDHWRRIRDEIHEDVCGNGFDRELGSFTQSYGSKLLDASLLLLPLVGFLPANDARIRRTIEAIQRELIQDGLVQRYRTEEVTVDGLPPGEGSFLPCTLWLADALALLGRRDEAVELFERVLALRNDLGLLAEEYDTESHRLVGNFPQALSHLALVNTAFNLEHEVAPMHRRHGSAH
ncbi:MAG: glycoside hydrolase family 15 protein [Gaiellaceae bacterium]